MGQSNSPSGNDTWTCGGYGTEKTAYVMCSSEIAPIVHHSTGNGSVTVDCDSNERLVGGGCDAMTSPAKRSSPASSNGWTCQGDKLATFKVWAFCSPRIQANIRVAVGGEWVSLLCEEGEYILSGGCEATEPPYMFSFSGPDREDGWKCGGEAGAKRIWAICAAGPSKPSKHKKK